MDVTLVTFGPAWGMPFQSSGPFPAKLEAWLRLTGIAYKGRIENNPGRGPKGKSPWIETAEGRMGDSELIIRWLAERRAIDLDAGLTPAQAAEGVAWRRLFEEHYHQIWEYLTFIDPGGAEAAEEYFVQLPALLRPVIRVAMKRALRRQLYQRGIGRHSRRDILQMGVDDIDAAAAHLGDRSFWLSDAPTLTDCTAFAFLALSVWTPPISPVHERARSHANLVHYCERMGNRLFAAEMGNLRRHAARPAATARAA